MTFRGGMAELMRQASRMQRKVEARKKELEAETISTSVGNDQVKVVVNGNAELVSIEIADALLQSGDASMICDLVVAGVNAGIRQSREWMDAEIEKVTGGFKIPGVT